MTFIWIFLKLQCIGDSIGDTLNRHIELHCLTPAGGCQFRMILHHKIRLKKHVHQMQHVLMYHFWANHIHLCTWSPPKWWVFFGNREIPPKLAETSEYSPAGSLKCSDDLYIKCCSCTNLTTTVEQTRLFLKEHVEEKTTCCILIYVGDEMFRPFFMGSSPLKWESNQYLKWERSFYAWLKCWFQRCSLLGGRFCKFNLTDVFHISSPKTLAVWVIFIIYIYRMLYYPLIKG